MAKPKNIAGQKVGSLTAIEISEEETSKRNSVAKIWKCQCDCGNTTYVSIANWGKTQSCGCRVNKYTLEVGDKIGNLTLVSKGDIVKKTDKNICPHEAPFSDLLNIREIPEASR